MWLALLAVLYSIPGTVSLLAGAAEARRVLAGKRPDARTFAAVLLALAALTGRWTARLLRPASTDDPHPLAPTRRGAAFGADGAMLEWEQFGPDNAPPILLTHGWSLTHDTWFYLKTNLPPEFRIIVWDMRGEGRSQAYRGTDYALETMADDLAAVFDSSGVGSGTTGCVLAGHSLGAMMLPLFAARHRERMKAVRGIALLAGTDAPLLQSMRGRRLLVPAQKLLWEPLARLMGACPAPFEIIARVLWQMGAVHLALMFGRHNDGGTRGQNDLVAFRCSRFSMRAAGLGAWAAFRHDARAATAAIPCPTLLLTGANDPNMPPETQRAMLSRLAQGELVLLPDCGHLSLLECHVAVTAHVRAFARRCLGV